ncbi:unnamed protein product, partial [Urochloa humidicola]
ESYHGLCTFHIMQNVIKHLSPVKGNEEKEVEKEVQEEAEEEDEETSILKEQRQLNRLYQQKKGAKKPKKNDDVQPLVEVQNGGNKKDGNVEPQEYNVISSFTQFLMAPISTDDDLLNQDLF